MDNSTRGASYHFILGVPQSTAINQSINFKVTCRSAASPMKVMRQSSYSYKVHIVISIQQKEVFANSMYVKTHYSMNITLIKVTIHDTAG